MVAVLLGPIDPKILGVDLGFYFPFNPKTLFFLKVTGSH